MKHVPLALLLLGACSPMPLKEGPKAQLFTGITEPRDRADMAVTETATIPPFIAMKCAQLYAKHGYAGYALAAASPMGWISQFGCAFTPWGSKAPKKEPIWCDIVYLAGNDTAREHELRHCEGWDHPKAAASTRRTGG